MAEGEKLKSNLLQLLRPDGVAGQGREGRVTDFCHRRPDALYAGPAFGVSQLTSASMPLRASVRPQFRLGQSKATGSPVAARPQRSEALPTAAALAEARISGLEDVVD